MQRWLLVQPMLCRAQRTRGGAGMSAELTPAEMADLRIIRGRAMMDRGDIAPMQRVSYRSMPTNGKAGAAFATTAKVIPWLEALNMEVGD